MTYGASQEEWDHFALGLGLVRDLLPVVSRPDAPISPKSKMKGVGKTPSIYNRNRAVAGLPNWTSRKATMKDVTGWMAEPDYGICIQTREVRALDIDVPDAALVEQIHRVIFETIGVMPTRTRNNSQKTLIAFRIAGDMPKRVIKVREKIVDEGRTVEPAWIIEFLATGQQFIAAGTHSTGARIEWRWHGHDDFPVITLEQFEKLWRILVERFGLSSMTLTVGARKRGPHVDVEDPVADTLEAKGLVLDYGKDGQAYIDCPWKDNHSGDSGDSQTAYFPRGTGGYDQGHFKCLHAGCAEKSDSDFKFALGLLDFDDLTEIDLAPPADEQEVTVIKPWPKMKRDKNGILPIPLNLRAALGCPDFCGVHLRYDTFRDDMMIAEVQENGDLEWRPMCEGDSMRLRQTFDARGFKPVGREMMRDAIQEHGERHQYDSAIEWLESLPPWDKSPRVTTFLHRYYGASNNEYTQAVGEYMWSAMAGRVLAPGVKADMAPVLSGFQGTRKSSAIEALVPYEDCFTEINLSDDEDKLARKMRGKLVLEIDELRGLMTRDNEWIKSFISRKVERWVPKYVERATSYKRRSIFIGTTNEIDLFADKTGHRRWLPAMVGRQADIEAIVRDRDQLWAEAREIFLAKGVLWERAERLAKHEHHKFEVTDVMEEQIMEWLYSTEELDGSKPVEQKYVTTHDIMIFALGRNLTTSVGGGKGLEMAIGKIMRRSGWERETKWKDGRAVKVWVPPLA